MSPTRGFREGCAPFPRIARPPGHRLTPDRFHPPRKSSLRIANKTFGFSHFSNFLKLREKLKICPFRTSRDDFDQKEAPHAPASASSRCARPFPTFPCFAQKVSIFEKNANWKIRKNSSGCYRNPALSNSPKIHPTPGTFSNPTSVTSSGSGDSKQLHPGGYGVYEGIRRPAHPPLPSSKDRYNIMRSDASRAHQHRRHLPEKHANANIPDFLHFLQTQASALKLLCRL